MTATPPPATATTTTAPAPGAGACDAHLADSAVVRQLLSRVGDKWSLLVIRTLNNGPLRFTELHRSIDGISQRMLTQTLRSLERDGLVSRQSFAEIPPRVEYRETELGRSLAEPVLGLVEWAMVNHERIVTARERFDEQVDAAPE